MIQACSSRYLGAGILLLLFAPGCHTYEVRQFDRVLTDKPVKFERVAVIMWSNMRKQAKQENKLFTEQLIVSLQKQAIDVAERQKVENLLVDAALVEAGMADLTDTERVKKLGRLLKADLIIYGDAIINKSYYNYYRRFFFNNNVERFRLQQEANRTGVVRLKGYPVLANHLIGLSLRAVDSATGEIVWVGYRFLAAAKMVDGDRPETLTNFEVIRNVCDEIIDELLRIRGNQTGG